LILYSKMFCNEFVFFFFPINSDVRNKHKNVTLYLKTSEKTGARFYSANACERIFSIFNIYLFFFALLAFKKYQIKSHREVESNIIAIWSVPSMF
jgi:hypothetical protein